MAEKPAGGSVQTADLLKSLARYRRDSGTLPPVHLWNPPLCDNVQMRIDRQGRWYYQESPIGRQAMVRLFSTVLRLDEDGCYYLVTPIEKIRVLVADRPFIVCDWQSAGSGPDRLISFKTNVGEHFALDREHPLHVDPGPGDEPAPHVLVRGNLEALLTRNVFYQLVQLALDEADSRPGPIGLYSSGQFFSLEQGPERPVGTATQ